MSNVPPSPGEIPPGPSGQQPPASPPPYGQQPPTGQAPYGQQPPVGPPPYGPPTYGQPPHAPLPAGSAPVPAFPPAPPVSIGEAFRYAWEGFKLDPLPWLIATLVAVVVSGIGESLESSLRTDTQWMDVTISSATPASGFVNLVFSIVGYVIGAAFIQTALRVTDGRRVTFADITTIPNLLQALLAAVILGLAVGIGLLLLVIPGLIIQVLAAWYLHLALDRGLSAVDALRVSVQLVTQNLGTTILFGLAAVGVLILGLLALFVGVFVAIPLIAIASAFVFRRLTGGPVMVPGSAG